MSDRRIPGPSSPFRAGLASGLGPPLGDFRGSPSLFASPSGDNRGSPSARRSREFSDFRLSGALQEGSRAPSNPPISLERGSVGYPQGSRETRARQRDLLHTSQLWCGPDIESIRAAVAVSH